MIRVYFATNRELSDQEKHFTSTFHHEPQNLRFGWADINRKKNRLYEIVDVCLAKDPTEPDKESSVTEDDQVIGAMGVFEKIRKEISESKCDLLCLIHGFSSDFHTSLERIAEIANDYSTKEKALIGFVFSWPSNGSLLEYYDDRSRAKSSGGAIARCFLFLLKFFRSLSPDDYCKQSIHLVAHSMGAWALSNALDDVERQHGKGLPRVFDQVFLMAADEDNDVLRFGNRMGNLHGMCNSINVYFSRDDFALKISDIFKNEKDRLGSTGPILIEDSKVTCVDCRLVDKPDPLETDGRDVGDMQSHQYYRMRTEVIEDVRQVISGLEPDEIVGRRYLQSKRTFQIIPAEKRQS